MVGLPTAISIGSAVASDSHIGDIAQSRNGSFGTVAAWRTVRTQRARAVADVPGTHLDGGSGAVGGLQPAAGGWVAAPSIAVSAPAPLAAAQSVGTNTRTDMATATKVDSWRVVTPGIFVGARSPPANLKAKSAPTPLAAASSVYTQSVARIAPSTVLDAGWVVTPGITTSAPAKLAAASAVGTKTVPDLAASTRSDDGGAVVAPGITGSAPAPDTAATSVITNTVVNISTATKDIIGKRGADQHQKGGGKGRHYLAGKHLDG